MNTASKNSCDNVIGACSSLAERRTTEFNVRLVKQKAVAFKVGILLKHIHLLHFRNTCLLPICEKDKSQGGGTLLEEMCFSYYSKTHTAGGNSMPSTQVT